MNFFMVGSFFMLFMLNAGWTSNYVIKLVGFLFFAVRLKNALTLSHILKSLLTLLPLCALLRWYVSFY